MKHYLDYNATAPLRPEVVALMCELLVQPLNASSVHAQGRKARGIIEDSRRATGEHIGAFANEIVFTGSATEANNWVLRSLRSLPLFISGVEHTSIYNTAHSIGTPEVLPVTKDGLLDLEQMEALLPDGEAFLVSLMFANNETGVIQPVREAAALIHARGGLLHCDAVQGLGRVDVNFSDLGCDLMTLSCHKMGGPVGAGALVIRSELTFSPLLLGGGQEMNRRAGTEDVAAIAGFAEAVRRSDLAAMNTLGQWLHDLESRVKAADSEAMIFGEGAPRLPNTSCIAMPGVPAETQLIRFDLEGIAVSAGSACTSGRTEPSHVLAAMGMREDIARTALRVSGGWGTTPADIEAFAAAWQKFLSRKAS